jgi:hypothetical protein
LQCLMTCKYSQGKKIRFNQALVCKKISVIFIALNFAGYLLIFL